jgi:hypothetical protein
MGGGTGLLQQLKQQSLPSPDAKRSAGRCNLALLRQPLWLLQLLLLLRQTLRV